MVKDTWLIACLVACLVAWLLGFLRTYSLTHLLTYLLTYLHRPIESSKSLRQNDTKYHQRQNAKSAENRCL